VLACLAPGESQLSVSDSYDTNLYAYPELLGYNSAQIGARITCVPGDPDTDGDGCPDSIEDGTDRIQGGERNKRSHWDFYDLNHDLQVDAMDIALVRSHFKPGGSLPPANAHLDRSVGTQLWAPGPPDGRINAIDIALVRAEFNHSCIAPP
jgi:hypothetical protein